MINLEGTKLISLEVTTMTTNSQSNNYRWLSEQRPAKCERGKLQTGDMLRWMKIIDICIMIKDQGYLHHIMMIWSYTHVQCTLCIIHIIHISAYLKFSPSVGSPVWLCKTHSWSPIQVESPTFGFTHPQWTFLAVFQTNLLISLDYVQDHRCQISCDMLDNWGMMKSMQGPCCCELNLNGRKQIFALRGNESKPLNTRLLWICTCFIGLYDATPRMTPMRSALPPGPRAWLWPPLLNITFAWPSNRICLELLFRCVIISTISMIIIWIDFADYNDYIDFADYNYYIDFAYYNDYIMTIL